MLQIQLGVSVLFNRNKVKTSTEDGSTARFECRRPFSGFAKIIDSANKV